MYIKLYKQSLRFAKCNKVHYKNSVEAAQSMRFIYELFFLRICSFSKETNALNEIYLINKSQI